MVRIIVFVPSPDMLKPVQQQAAEWENDEISINVVHRFGTPEILYQLDNYDVIVARGITYNKICNIYPEKHITRLRFDGMDLVEALFQCRNTYHPHHIGLCLGRDRLQDLLPELEELSDARISLYDVQDEESARDAVNACLRDVRTPSSAAARYPTFAGSGTSPAPISICGWKLSGRPLWKPSRLLTA